MNLFFSLPIFLFLLVRGARGAQAAGEAACAQPGQTRCDGGHQSVCLAQSLRWMRVRDCAAAGLVCAQGDCVPARSARADTCNPSTDSTRCTDDCSAAQMCLTSGVWLTLETCNDEELCDKDTFTCKPAEEANCGSKITCSGLSAKLPNLKNSSQYYDCTDPSRPKIVDCGEDSKDYYNACSGACDYDYDPKIHYPDDCRNNMGYSNFMFSNPALYYVCLNDQPFWKKCDTGYYESEMGDCNGVSDYSKSCTFLQSD